MAPLNCHEGDEGAIFVAILLLGLEESLSWQKVNSMSCIVRCEVGFIGGWLSLCAPIYIE